MQIRSVAVSVLGAALLLAAGCADEPSPPTAPSPSAAAPAKSLAELWGPQLRALDTSPCAGEGSGTRAVSFECERAIREVHQVAPLVKTDATSRGVPALGEVADAAGRAASLWLDGGLCTQALDPASTERLDCLTELWTAMNGPHKMLETMQQSGN